MMSSSYSLCGLLLLFVPSILPNISSFICLLLCILHMCPNSPSFLPISFRMIFSFAVPVFDHINRCSLLSVSILFLVGEPGASWWVGQVGVCAIKLQCVAGKQSKRKFMNEQA